MQWIFPISMQQFNCKVQPYLFGFYKKSTYNVGNDRTSGQVRKHYPDDNRKLIKHWWDIPSPKLLLWSSNNFQYYNDIVTIIQR